MREFQKVRSQLIATTNIDRLDFIRDGGFFEQNGNFFPVWSRPEIEIDHLSPPCGWLVASNRNGPALGERSSLSMERKAPRSHEMTTYREIGNRANARRRQSADYTRD